MSNNIDNINSQIAKSQMITASNFAQYLNKEDTPTMKNRDFIAKYQPRFQKIYQSLGNCMKGKQDTSQQVKICIDSSLSKEEADFYKGYNIAIMGIRASEPNMNEIKSKFRTTCGDIVN